ncbi:hypothetical protein C8R47DRAFT_1084913 [Mycena vitilis]|nr:hypothetical protein C8R47DRAFT_1085238 [Mycena vitilis]KAJ6447730.1 hypothetical protein C8R47DRAFT_1085193 [Mycena vitilis]KAJ6448794.1 hypothetical protein C8R47DRAFT_1084913 [Mycena vitilis]
MVLSRTRRGHDGLQLLKKIIRVSKTGRVKKNRPIGSKDPSMRNRAQTSIATADHIVELEHPGVVEMCDDLRFPEAVSQEIIDDLRDIRLPVRGEGVIEEAQPGILVRMKVGRRNGGQLVDKSLVHRPLTATKHLLQVAQEREDEMSESRVKGDPAQVLFDDEPDRISIQEGLVVGAIAESTETVPVLRYRNKKDVVDDMWPIGEPRGVGIDGVLNPLHPFRELCARLVGNGRVLRDMREISVDELV